MREVQSSPLSRHRQALGWMAAVAVVLLAWWLHHAVSDVGNQLPLASLLLLAGTVLVAPLGGRSPALLAAQLRRKLEDDPAHPRHLVTSSGLGYTLER